MRISDSEMEIMRIIWDADGEVTTAYVLERLGTQRKKTTVLTFLKRLTDKKAIRTRKEGKTNYYEALISEDEYKKAQTEEFLREMHSGSLSSFFAALYGDSHPDKEDMDELREWFENID